MIKLNLNIGNMGRKDIASLQTALGKLRLPVAPDEKSTAVLGVSTREAIRALQQKAGLPATGELTTETVAHVNTELAQAYFSDSKTRTERLHTLLGQVGLPISPAETAQRKFGETTSDAVKAFQTKQGLPATGLIDDNLFGRMQGVAFQARLDSKTQVGILQRQLLRAGKIAKLNLTIDPGELKTKVVGPTVSAAVNAFQKKYGLPVTGALDLATATRIESVAASRKVLPPALKVRTGDDLTLVKRALRLNMTNKHVGEAQKTLAFLGYRIDLPEFNAKTFGASTRSAVLEYQKKMNLPATGHLEKLTMRRLNAAVAAANPAAQATRYRVRGAVRDLLWQGQAGLKVQVYQKVLRGQGPLLSERKTMALGFFDIPYDPPKDPVNQQILSPFHLQVVVKDPADNQLFSKVLFNPTLIAWANFTAGGAPYRGPSLFETQDAAATRVAGNIALEALREDKAQQEITHVSLNSGLSIDDVMQLVLSHLTAKQLNDALLPSALCYAFIRQNLPPNLPSDLLQSTVEWTLIDQLVEHTANGIVFMDTALQSLAFDQAALDNLMPIAIVRQKDAIMAKLATLRLSFALDKPTLAGNGSLQALLNITSVPPANHTAVAETFLQHQGFGDDFWADVKARPEAFGGSAAVTDLETIVNVGFIAKNHVATVSFLKQAIDTARVPDVTSANGLAKLTPGDWGGLITANGGAVPDWAVGNTPDEKVKMFASVLANRSELLFPTTAFVSEVGRSAATALTQIVEVTKLTDANPELDLRKSNIDQFVEENKLDVAAPVLTEMKVLQRVQRISPNAVVGRALLEANIHSASQILAIGKERLVATLGAKQIDQPTALSVFSLAQFQTAGALKRLTDYRAEINRTPAAIISYTYTPSEQEAALPGFPNLKTLFGSQDYCDCQQCQSVLSPSAYLADTLHFLEEHPAEAAAAPRATVQKVLFSRRPDIGNIKFNCDNTNTPLPYIDLVCEILENAVPAPATNSDFSFQTTLTPEELRAFPENVRREAYDVLKTADFPLYSSFNLWQEETRVLFDHLGVPRYTLMDAFQNRNPGTILPADLSIAGEYWGLSTNETRIVTTDQAASAQQDVIWGFDTTETAIVVTVFLDHTRLQYNDLLDLLQVQWLNPSDAPAGERLILQRPVDSCATDDQHITQLTPGKFDLIQRFLRLWRRTGWKMWELDLLLRASNVANGNLDGDGLTALQRVGEIQDRLKVSVEAALSLSQQINVESRVSTGDVTKKFPSLYEILFQNPGVIKPVDAAFALPLGPGGLLEEHKATLLAAFAVTETELNLLRGELPDDNLTLGNLTELYSYTLLSRSLNIPVQDLLSLTQLRRTPILGSPGNLIDFLDDFDWVRQSGFTIPELEYLLRNKASSPYGMRVETITQSIEGLRENLRAATAALPEGAIAGFIATTFSITPDQSRILLDQLALMPALTNPALTARDASGAYTTPVTEANFPAMYAAFRLIDKAAMLVNRLTPDEREDLEWLMMHAGAIHSLSLSDLPVAAEPVNPLFPAWLILQQWLIFRGLFPPPEGTSLSAIFDAALSGATTLTDVQNAVVNLTMWKLTDLEALTNGWGLQKADFQKVATYLRLRDAFQQIKRLGGDAAQVLRWADRDSDAGGRQFITVQEVRQAAKSKYEASVWLSRVTPLQDVLREKKRDALSAYLVESSLRSAPPAIVSGGKIFPNPEYWRDSNDLLGYFLIDVDMSACQLTSRIKQAISSVQMFVQRCFLNLEQPYVEIAREEREDSVSLNSWNQWKWRKSYGMWAANRNVFLYPENWIEPELRDDKSPFFEDLESEILQSEITHENAEAAFRHYLEKTNEVARLDITGIYHEVDDLNPSDGLNPDVSRVHVIGRTRATPSVYYYRAFDLLYGSWTAWERIDADITGDHVIPVIYNRKLHLFWLIFLEKPQKVKKQPPAKASDAPSDTPEPPMMLEVQLAWSERTVDGWTSKKVGKQKMVHPWERPQFSYHLKARYKSRENLLWLDLYISTSQRFNNTRFWDAYKNTREYVTAFRWDEKGRPWHSSSFVFDGQVVDIKLKGLSGFYHVLQSDGTVSQNLIATDSHQYVHDNFGQDGEKIGSLLGKYEIGPRLVLPDGMHIENTRLVNNRQTANDQVLNVLENETTRTLLRAARAPFEMVFSQHRIQADSVQFGPSPMMYQDPARSFFIKPEWESFYLSYSGPSQRVRYTFYPFYHPYSNIFLRELNRSGVDGLLTRRMQVYPQTFYPGNSYTFPSYQPQFRIIGDSTAQTDVTDFSQYGAYSIYNWEIFFHAPLLIATKLTQNQRFEDAMRWFQFIFDPTSADTLSVPQRYWITKPFYEQNSEDYRRQRIGNLLQDISNNTEQLRAWLNSPFKPHLIARGRPVAYQKTVVMKYIDNLVAWGDQLFRQDTIEALNEATMLYVLAYELLGPRPVKVPNIGRADFSFNELEAAGALDPFGNENVEVQLENYTGQPVQIVQESEDGQPLPRLEIAYFCLPANDQMMSYWDTVADRLFKIRHCMNIEGVVRQLPLFEPPIDPALLVKAAAAGIDLSSVLSDSAAPQGQYRFRQLAAKAAEFCGEVRVLGEKMLAALEKKDAEGLALLRSANETQLLTAVSDVRKLQISEATQLQAALESAKDLSDEKSNYYTSREFMNPWEGTAITLGGVSALAETAIAVGYILAGGLNFIPGFIVGAAGFGGSPTATAEVIDGVKVSRAAEAAVSTLSAISRAAEKFSALASTMAGFQRRKEEWDFQGRLAGIEGQQIAKQIEAASIRLAISEKELENHELQIEQSQSADDYMRNKYTNQQLYSWMITQLSTVYFQAYQLSYDLAKRAEKAYRFELGDPSATFIQFGYWDSLKKGLVSGERLANDIHRMETAYLDQNKRELELTKHVSLAQVFPLSLLELKLNGSCSVTLPEWLFDTDYPGHYRRRITSVAITIPCVAGPYTNVNCTLSLTSNGIRMTTGVAAGYGDPLTTADERFARNPVPIQSIATSHAQNDAGLFELSFNDERYLPFEGAGAVSQWTLSLPKASNAFDLTSVADVILHIRYSATAGDLPLVNAAIANLATVLPTSGVRLTLLNHEFSTAWYRFFHPDAGQDQELVFTMANENLPFFARNKITRPTRVHLLADGTDGSSFDVDVTFPGGRFATSMPADPGFGGTNHAEEGALPPAALVKGEWRIKMMKTGAADFRSLTQSDLLNAYLIVEFRIA